MRDADTAGSTRQPLAARPEGEPHLTFHALLADTLHEMHNYDTQSPTELDAMAALSEEALTALRGTGAPIVRPFHHAYLTPISSPALEERHPTLDVRS